MGRTEVLAPNGLSAEPNTHDEAIYHPLTRGRGYFPVRLQK
jgi:hypothetical protein